MEGKMAGKDILTRNGHHNPFQLKVPSHNASQHLVRTLWHAWTLNKLALLPFPQQQCLAQLYRLALEHLLALPKQSLRDQGFVEGLTEHLCTWEQQMHQFGSWPYTRVAFYSLEDKVRRNRELWEEVVLKRALLEPNKQQFLSRAQTQSFQNPRLVSLLQQLKGRPPPSQTHDCQMPSDIVLYDHDHCWLHLQNCHQTLDSQLLQDYLQEYLRTGVQRLVTRIADSLSRDSLREALGLRRRVAQAVGGCQYGELREWQARFSC